MKVEQEGNVGGKSEKVQKKIHARKRESTNKKKENHHKNMGKRERTGDVFILCVQSLEPVLHIGNIGEAY